MATTQHNAAPPNAPSPSPADSKLQLDAWGSMGISWTAAQLNQLARVEGIGQAN